MLDRFITPVIRPAVEAIATGLARRGMRAGQVIFATFGIGVVAMVFKTLHV